MMPPKSIRFEAFTLDLERLCLHGPSGQVNLRRKCFEVLRHLVKHAGRVVTKEELINAVWPDVTVSDESLTQCISEIRRVIGEDSQRIIKTVPRRGYLVDVPIAAHPVIAAGSPPEIAVAAGALLSVLPPPDRPSIAVLPFTNMSGDPEQEYFADGMVEDIITELSRFGGLFVIARNSSFQWKGKPADVGQVGRDLGVRYVLEGSVRRVGDRIRISAQLIEAETGGHFWAEKYDHEYADIFALQDRITENVVAAIEPEILVGEGRRAMRKNPTNLDAFDCCMRGLWHLYQLGPNESRQSESWQRRSIELDPTFARAHTLLARTLTFRCWSGFSDDIDRDFQTARAAAERAVTLDDRDPAGHCALAFVNLLTRKHERALASARQAIELNSNFALGHFALGETHTFMGNFVEMIDPMTRCLRLSPRDPLASLFVGLFALSNYHIGNYQQAIDYCERALRRRRLYVVLRTLAATLGQVGRTEEARAVLAEMEGIKPANAKGHWQVSNPYANPAHEAHLLEGLRKAGWPDN